MESEVIGILEWNQEVNDIQNGEIQNYARFKHMMVNRTGKLDVLLRQCNRGYEVQCFGGIEGGSSSLMILFIVINKIFIIMPYKGPTRVLQAPYKGPTRVLQAPNEVNTSVLQ